MAYLAVNKDGTEVIGESLVRCRLNKHHWIEPCSDYRNLNKENTDF